VLEAAELVEQLQATKASLLQEKVRLAEALHSSTAAPAGEKAKLTESKHLWKDVATGL
jgi:hypothetical protein